jgi:DNA-binding response OmpR family regulator
MARILVVDDSPTLRKVVTSILERHGYEALAAADGIVALDVLTRSDVPFDLVLLDFVMPKMNGFQFCRALRTSDRFANMPVVLMSAKSDKIRDNFVDQTGAMDAISKPFDAQALIVAIENALRRVSQGRISAARPTMDTEDLEVSSATDIGQLKARVAHQAASKIAAAIAPILASVPRDAIGDRGQITSALANGLSADVARDVSVALRRIDVGEGSLSLAGDLATVPIGAILQMLQVECKSGVLVVSNGLGSEVTITMRLGLIDLVQSRGAGDEFRLGRFFVEEGFVTPHEIDALLRDARGTNGRTGETPSLADAPTPTSDRISVIPPPPRSPSGEMPAVKPRVLLGDALLQSGLIDEDQLNAALARQSSELIYEVLRWPKGWFEFRIAIPPVLARRAKLALPVASVVMEGFRRVDEWRLVEQGLGSFESKLVRDPVAIDALRIDDLARPERIVLEAIDGDRTVRGIIAASHMSSFDACRILLQFLEARIVRRRQA